MLLQDVIPGPLQVVGKQPGDGGVVFHQENPFLFGLEHDPPPAREAPADN
jgi:hypothetical protein